MWSIYITASTLLLVIKSILADDTVINTTYGPVKGVNVTLPTGKKLVKFLGIPYANASRFGPPRQPTKWTTTLNATKYGKSCPQPTNTPPYYFKPENLSEFCLSLNVFVPNTTAFQAKKASYPVLVMIHGGAFLLGAGLLIDGSILSTEGEVVVVTMNYRLGALGFISLGQDGMDGNYGLLDVIESLRWVQHNIKSFGGDPNKVTLGGWSAGSRLASILTTVPLASGLYHQVILMSGHAGSDFSYMEQKVAYSKAWYFGGLLRCPHPSSDFMNCMKRRTANEYVQAQAKMHLEFSNWAPVVDGKVVRDSPDKLLEEGKFNVSTVLAGVANDDGSAFLDTIPGINEGIDVTNGLTRNKFIVAINSRTWLPQQSEIVPATIAFMYTDWLKPDDVNITRRLYLDLLTDFMYRAPAVQSVNAYSAKKDSSVYFYQFEHTGQRASSWMNARHGDEKRYLFPAPTMDSISGMTKTMIDYWVNFLYKGNPSNPGWSKYDVKSQKYMAIRSFPVIENHLRPVKMAFWNEFLPKNGKGAVKQTAAKDYRPSNKSDDATTALIITCCLFAIFIVIFVPLTIFLVKHKSKRQQSTTTKAYQSPPVSPKENTQFQSPPVKSPNYNHQYPTDEIGHHSPLPKYHPQSFDNIDFVDHRSTTNERHMESDML